MLAVMIQASAIESVQEIEANLVALAPLVVLISSFVLSPEASDRLKRLVPLVVSAAVTILTFVVTEFPGAGFGSAVEVVGNIALVTGIAVAIYSSISAAIPGAKSLNELTGPGVVK